ncbi:MAG TPA: LLM class flavin-dependent oxidoreductase [Thermomicrobiales bacterium]|nr:LLM class flavin-dependent oxidoreductase [Thermomicrobiales bacterium]
MIFGIHIGQQNIEIDELRKLWTYVDRNGFGWVSVWDHMYCRTNDADPHHEAVALMAALALDTENVEIGNLVFCAAYRNAGVLVKSLITVDHLSGGRVNAGIGAGWHEPEFRAFGIPFLPVKNRMDMLEEHAAAMRSLLNNEVTDFDGEYVQLTNAYMNPRPARDRMPLWVGGGGEKRTLRITARHADGWNVPYIGPEAYAHKSQVLDDWCEKEGRNPAEIMRALNLGFYMAANEASRDEATQKYYDQFQEQAADRIEGHLLGTPAEVIDRIGQFRDAGVERLNIAIRPPVDWDAVHAFAEEVIPAFR